jgi:hypothetical protein
LLRIHFSFVGLALVGAGCALSLPSLSAPPAKAIPSPNAHASILPSRAPTIQDWGRLPLSFEPNRGQTNARVRFLTHTGNNALFLTPSEAIFTLSTTSDRSASQAAPRKAHNARLTVENSTRIALRMQIVGADPKASALQRQPLAGRINYFVGKDPGKWQVGVPTFGQVGFHGVYPGIDLVYYGNQRNLEYDFVVAPHADPKQIQLHFAGAQGVQINAEGDLVVRAHGREVMWRKPVVYQQVAAGRHPVAAHFQLKTRPNGEKSVGFALGHYDSARSLVIDPVLLYSTYLGGGSTESGNSIAVDSAGNAYVTGSTASGTFPTTSGAFQRTKQTTTVGFVTKFNAAGTALIYSTFLGGSGPNGDQPYSIAIDSSGDAYIAGFTSSTDFPTTPGALQTVNNAQSSGFFNGFVTKLDPTGSALIYSTYLGGTGHYGDQAHAIAIDSSGNAYVAGSAHSSDFPTTAGAFQRVNKESASGYNAFVAKLNSTGTALIYSTLLGGSGLNGDQADSIAIDSSGNAYIAGSTGSSDFPTTPGAFQPVSVAHDITAYNAFVTKLNPTGTALVYSTFLGGSKYIGDAANSIAIDSGGNAYVTGYATSTDFPTTPGAFQRVNRAQGGYYNGFVTKLNPTGAALIYSTFLGGSGAAIDYGLGIAADSSGNAYVTGEATSTDFPITTGAFQRTKTSGLTVYSAFVTKLDPTGSALIYSSYLRGNGSSGNVNGVDGDVGIGITLDAARNVYVVGAAASADFPVTPGAFQSTNGATFSHGSNAFVTKMALIPIFPDFNADHHPDLLIQNPTTGLVGYYHLQGPLGSGSAAFSLTPPTEYALVGVGDFSGTGTQTLVLQSSLTNKIALWYTGGTNNAIISGGNFVNATPDADWKVVAVGDFNGDGKSDLVFQNKTTNQVAIWFMNGFSYQGGVLMPFTPPAGWKVVGAGDFNKDNSTDLAFQNQTTGQIALWYMNGATYVDGIVMATLPAPGWTVTAVGDYNEDGYADLLFQDPTGKQFAAWYQQNGAYTGGDLIPITLLTGLKVVGPH